MGVQNASRSRGVPAPARFRAWVRAAAAGQLEVIEVTIRLVGANEGRRLNFAYRGNDCPTNVLTFAYAPPQLSRRAAQRPSPQSPARSSAQSSAQSSARRGDIVLCPAVVAREALDQGKTLAAHYAHLTVHAVLHLRGYDHARPADAGRMERAEIRILKRLGHPNPYII